MGSTRRLAGFGIVSVLVLAMAACSDDAEPTSPSTTAASASSTAPATPSGSASSSASGPATSSTTTDPDEEPLTGFDLDEKDGGGFPDLGDDIGPGEGVRVGRHEGYDRVVFDFTGTGTPTYRVRYVDTPVADGSGDTVSVDGDAYLEVLVTTVSIPGAGQERPADSSAADLEGTVVAEANAIFGGFEGYGQTFIGVRDTQRPFRVSVESAPTRLVVDIAR